jgi:hypothetical protein
MSRGPSATDERWSEVNRTAGLALLAMLDGDNKTAADLIRTFDNPRDAWIVTAGIAHAALAEQGAEGRGFVLGLIGETTGEWFVNTQSQLAKATDLLRRELADGKRHSYVSIRALALSQGIKSQDLRNAAQRLRDEGLISGDVNAPGHWYQLRRSKARVK